MSYRLDQFSTPAWAAQGQLDLNPNSIPAYFKPANPDTSPSLHFEQQHSRWSDIKQQLEQRRDGGVDSGLLEKYSLSGKWKDELETGSRQDDGSKLWFLNSRKIHRTGYKLLRSNPFVPLTLRGLALVFAICALGLACRIFVLNRPYPTGQQASTILTIVVETLAVLYLGYTIYNEFFGKPLGLRTAKSKMLFVLCDIVFTIFTSAILSLAFEVHGRDSWACGFGLENNSTLCNRQRDLVAMEFVSLVMFLFTFLVSIYRMMETAAH